MKQFVEVELLDAHGRYTLRELCEHCSVNADTVMTFVEFGIVSPQTDDEKHWLFSAQALSRMNRALRLQRDLEVNLPGLALALDLLDRIDELEQAMDIAKREL